MSQSLPESVRRRVLASFSYRCAYCQTSERLVGPVLEVDHVIPQSRGGTDEETNLVAACTLCNSHKAQRIEAVDPVTGSLVRLFNPFEQRWADHFMWEDGAKRVRGRTATGRATVAALHMNHPAMIAARAVWETTGLHPPQ